MKHLVIIDGHHLMYRAYWAIPRTLKSRTGEQSNIAFGVASMLLAILAKEQPDALLFCFDAGSETFRHQENETYKDGRAETPDDFHPQIPRVFELIDAFGFSQVSDARYEADDFLCTYALSAAAIGSKVTIVTGDRDAFQLASDAIRIAIPHKGYQQAEYLGPKEVEAKLGVRPDQVASYKGLCGDSSDNLPGVMGIGPKTAAILLQTYGSLSNLYENLPKVKPVLREKLERDREQAFFCERMAVLKSDIELPVPLDALMLSLKDSAPVAAFFDELSFTLLQRRLQALVASPYGAEHFIPSSFVPVQESTAKKVEDDSQLRLF